MRFVDTGSLLLREVADSEVSELENGYAILSHTWMKGEEISYKDMEVPFQQLDHKKGYEKLRGACAMAKFLGHEVIWIDTCCINKDSTSELSEAIRSMYRWYANAAVCIAYLQDVGPGLEPIQKSRWFTRGWTLQELIAPSRVKFYNHRWVHLGDKSELGNVLSEITRIPHDVLQNSSKAQQCSVAQRMSWAANRQTTRIEDIAYSLIGLFNISLITDYGEREHAFIRLQEAIAQRWADETIFAWHMCDDTKNRKRSGLFATSPNEFEHCGQLVSTGTSEGFGIGNMGLSISLLTKPWSLGTYLAVLNVKDKNDGAAYGILLARLDIENQYTRVCDSKWSGLIRVTEEITSYRRRSITVHQDATKLPEKIFPGFWLRRLEPPGVADFNPIILSRSENSESDRITLPEGIFGTAGVVWLAPVEDEGPRDERQIRWIKLGFDAEGRPVCLLASAKSYLRSAAFKDALRSKPDERHCQKVFEDSWMGHKRSLPKWRKRSTKRLMWWEWDWPSGYTVLRDRRGRFPDQWWHHPGQSYDEDEMQDQVWHSDRFYHEIPTLGLVVCIEKHKDLTMAPQESGSDSRVRSVWVVDIWPVEREPEPYNPVDDICGLVCGVPYIVFMTALCVLALTYIVYPKKSSPSAPSIIVSDLWAQPAFRHPTDI